MRKNKLFEAKWKNVARKKPVLKKRAFLWLNFPVSGRFPAFFAKKRGSKNKK